MTTTALIGGLAMTTPAAAAAAEGDGGYQYEHYFATQTGVVADVSQAKYPRALLLQHQADPADDGVMLGSLQVYYGNTDADDAKRHIPVFRSDDLGKTWDYSYSGVYNQVDRGPGYELTSQGQLYELPVAVGDMPAGTILLSALARKWVQHDNDPGGYSSYIDVYKSSDVGKTWQYVSTVAQGGTAVEGKDPIWEPFLYAYDRGDGGPNRLVVYYSDERPSYVGQMLVHQVSTDGLSWGPVVWDVFDAAEGRTPSASYATPGRPGMFSMAEMNDGRYIATYEYCGTAVSQTAVGGCAVNYRISDDPENWQQDANRNYQVQIPDTGYRPVGTPYVTNLPNVGPHGAVVVSGNGSRNGVFVSYDYGAPGSWVYYYSSVFTSYSRSLVTMPDGRSMFAVSSPAAPAVEWARGTQYLADASPVVADGTWRLESAATAGAYLKVADDDTRTGVSDNGKPTQGWVTQGADSVSTAWRLVPATGAAGWYRVQNVNSGLYLDIEAGSTANAANVFQQGLDPSSGSQLWRLRDMGNGHVLLMNRKSGKTINPTSTQVPQGKLVQYPEGAPTGSGLSIASYEAGGSFSQQWVLTRVNPVRDPSVTTQASVAPVLPTSVEVSTGGVVYGDAASTEQAPVAWDALDPASYAAPGTVQVPGTATFAGLTYPVTATVQVVAPDPPAVSFTTPATGASVSGTVTVTVALSVLGLQAYNLRVDSAGLQYRWQPADGEQAFSLDTTTLTNGSHTLLATASNAWGAKITVTEQITVANPTPWSPSSVYTGGDQVAYAGSVWRAMWWTQNQTPGDVNGPWEQLASAPDGTALWTPTRVFTAGQTVTYQGSVYRAKWWTRNQAPGDPYGPWTPIG